MRTDNNNEKNILINFQTELQGKDKEKIIKLIDLLFPQV